MCQNSVLHKSIGFIFKITTTLHKKLFFHLFIYSYDRLHNSQCITVPTLVLVFLIFFFFFFFAQSAGTVEYTDCTSAKR